MGRRRSNVSIEVERQEQAERGKRMKDIRENELKMTENIKKQYYLILVLC